MKKPITFLASFFVLALSASVSAGPGDTLGVTEGTFPKYAPTGQELLIPVLAPSDAAFTASGFLYGTHWLKLKSNGAEQQPVWGLAQRYLIDDSYEVVGILARLNRVIKGPSGAETSITFKLTGVDEEEGGSTTNAQGMIVPFSGSGPALRARTSEGNLGTVLASKEVLFEELVVGDFSVAMFDEPVIVEEDIFAIVDFQALRANGDTLSFGCDPSGSGPDRFAFLEVYFAQPGGWATIWVRVQNLLPTFSNNNIALFPVLGERIITDIQNIAFFEGHRAMAMPNPANETTTIRFENKENGNYTLELLSINGKTVLRRDLGFRASGMHTTELNVADIPAGTYLYSLVNETDGTRYTKTMVIAH